MHGNCIGIGVPNTANMAYALCVYVIFPTRCSARKPNATTTNYNNVYRLIADKLSGAGGGCNEQHSHGMYGNMFPYVTSTEWPAGVQLTEQ